jgi:hypothetical protein
MCSSGTKSPERIEIVKEIQDILQVASFVLELFSRTFSYFYWSYILYELLFLWDIT